MAFADGGNAKHGKGNITVPVTYSTTTLTATEFASRLVGRRFHLPAPTARLVVFLSGLGGGQ